MPAKRRKKRKVVRFKTVTFKISSRQKRSLMNYCNARGITPNKLIKRCIRKYLEGFADHVPENYFITEKQLELFAEVEMNGLE
jgi:hypothetical protein